MDVQVEDGLSGSGPHIQYRAIAVFDAALSGHVSGRQMAKTNDVGIFCGRFLQSANMFFGDHEDMRRRLRIDVLEGQGVLVLVNFLRGNLTGNNAAEQAVFHVLCRAGRPRPPLLILMIGPGNRNSNVRINFKEQRARAPAPHQKAKWQNSWRKREKLFLNDRLQRKPFPVTKVR